MHGPSNGRMINVIVISIVIVNVIICVKLKSIIGPYMGNIFPDVAQGTMYMRPDGDSFKLIF